MSKSRKAEKIKEELRRLATQGENRSCFDCGMRGPLYAVVDFHVFVCTSCSAIHRSQQHKIKGISMSEFTDQEVVGLRVGGNAAAAKVWRKNFNGTLPKDANEREVRNFIRQMFEERRWYDSEAHKALDEAVESGNLPQVVPLPKHMHPDAPSGSFTPPQQPSPQPQPVQAPPQPPAPAAAPAGGALDSMFGEPVQAVPAIATGTVAQNTAQEETLSPTSFFTPSAQPSVQQTQPAPQPHPQTQVRSSGLNMNDLFGDDDPPASQAPRAPGAFQQPMNPNAQFAVQQQMHSASQYSSQGDQTHAAQHQMSDAHGRGSGGGVPAPQYAAQYQMGGAGAQGGGAHSTPQYAAQHQMNSHSQYGGGQQQGGDVNFFQSAPPQQQQQQQQQYYPPQAQQQGHPAGYPPMPGYQQQQQQPQQQPQQHQQHAPQQQAQSFNFFEQPAPTQQQQQQYHHQPGGGYGGHQQHQQQQQPPQQHYQQGHQQQQQGGDPFGGFQQQHSPQQHQQPPQQYQQHHAPPPAMPPAVPAGPDPFASLNPFMKK